MGQMLAAGCCGAWAIWRRSCFRVCSKALDPNSAPVVVVFRQPENKKCPGEYWWLCGCSFYFKLPRWTDVGDVLGCFYNPQQRLVGWDETNQQSGCLECSLRSGEEWEACSSRSLKKTTIFTHQLSSSPQNYIFTLDFIHDGLLHGDVRPYTPGSCMGLKYSNNKFISLTWNQYDIYRYVSLVSWGTVAKK